MLRVIQSIIHGLAGAAFACVIAVGFIGVLFGFPLVFLEVHPMDREKDLAAFPNRLAFAAIAGLILGGLAGFASRLVDRRVSFVRSVAVVGVCAVVTRIITEPRFVGERDSYMPTVAAAILGAVAVVAWGFLKGRWEAQAISTAAAPQENSH